MGKGGTSEEPEPAGAPEAAEGETEVADLTSVDPQCIEWVKASATSYLRDLEESMWQLEHDETIAEFVVSTGTRRLLAWIDPSAGLTLSIAVPSVDRETLEITMMYFLKPETVLTADTISKVVQYGTVAGAPAGSMLRLMSSVLVPRCLKDQSWPDTIKKEFTGQLHRFMASLTETAWDQVSFERAPLATVTAHPPRPAYSPSPFALTRTLTRILTLTLSAARRGCISPRRTSRTSRWRLSRRTSSSASSRLSSTGRDRSRRCMHPCVAHACMHTRVHAHTRRHAHTHALGAKDQEGGPPAPISHHFSRVCIYAYTHTHHGSPLTDRSSRNTHHAPLITYH